MAGYGLWVHLVCSGLGNDSTGYTRFGFRQYGDRYTPCVNTSAVGVACAVAQARP